MSCDNVVGVKNIMIKFTNCETGAIIGPIAHDMAKDDLPTWRLYPFKIEELPGGYIIKHHSSSKGEMEVIRDLRVPMVDYQGRSQIDLQVEYENGLVYTGTTGGVQGEEMTDTHGVKLSMSFKSLSELLPPGALAQQ